MTLEGHGSGGSTEKKGEEGQTERTVELAEGEGDLAIWTVLRTTKM